MNSFNEKFINDCNTLLAFKARPQNNDNKKNSILTRALPWINDDHNITQIPRKYLNDTPFTIKLKGKHNDVHQLVLKKYRHKQFKQQQNDISIGDVKEGFKRTKTKKNRINLCSEY